MRIQLGNSERRKGPNLVENTVRALSTRWILYVEYKQGVCYSAAPDTALHVAV